MVKGVCVGDCAKSKRELYYRTVGLLFNWVFVWHLDLGLVGLDDEKKFTKLSDNVKK